jgi:(p)ppGpp synthase/HD superfamily hydrolase
MYFRWFRQALVFRKSFLEIPKPNSNGMKQDFTLEIAADNNFSILNRIVNVLNRRRVRIKKLMAHENEDDFP